MLKDKLRDPEFGYARNFLLDHTRSRYIGPALSLRLVGGLLERCATSPLGEGFAHELLKVRDSELAETRVLALVDH